MGEGFRLAEPVVVDDLTLEGGHHGQRDADDGHQEIGHGQRQDQQVLLAPQLPPATTKKKKEMGRPINTVVVVVFVVAVVVVVVVVVVLGRRFGSGVRLG